MLSLPAPPSWHPGVDGRLQLAEKMVYAPATPVLGRSGRRAKVSRSRGEGGNCKMRPVDHPSMRA